MYLLIFVETDFFDEPRNTSVDWRDMLSHLRIISIFNVSKVNEPGTNIGDTTDKKTDYHNIIYNLLGFLAIIIIYILNSK